MAPDAARGQRGAATVNGKRYLDGSGGPPSIASAMRIPRSTKHSGSRTRRWRMPIATISPAMPATSCRRSSSTGGHFRQMVFVRRARKRSRAASSRAAVSCRARRDGAPAVHFPAAFLAWQYAGRAFRFRLFKTRHAYDGRCRCVLPLLFSQCLSPAGGRDAGSAGRALRGEFEREILESGRQGRGLHLRTGAAPLAARCPPPG